MSQLITHSRHRSQTASIENPMAPEELLQQKCWRQVPSRHLRPRKERLEINGSGRRDRFADETRRPALCLPPALSTALESRQEPRFGSTFHISNLSEAAFQFGDVGKVIRLHQS